MITKIDPHPCLNKTIEYYWIEKNGVSSVKILPDGTTSVIFNIGSPINISDNQGDYAELSNNLIVGAHKKYYLIKESTETHLIGIKFKQGGAYHFLKLPMMEFSDKIINLHDVLNGESERLREMLVEAKSEEQIRILLNQYFLKKVDIKSKSSDIVDYAIANVKVNGSPTSIKDLCESANISNKHLITLFNQKVGFPPKLIHRLNKFIKVIELIQQKNQVNWPEIAFECNYYDQSHLINDFKGFSGLSPKNYYENENAHGLRVIFG